MTEDAEFNNIDENIANANEPILSILTKDLSDYPSCRNQARKAAGLSIATSDLGWINNSTQLKRTVSTFEGESSFGNQCIETKTKQVEAANLNDEVENGLTLSTYYDDFVSMEDCFDLSEPESRSFQLIQERTHSDNSTFSDSEQDETHEYVEYFEHDLSMDEPTAENELILDEPTSTGEPVRGRVNRGSFFPVPVNRRTKSRRGSRQHSSLTARNAPPAFKINISCKEILDKSVSLIGQIPFAQSIMLNTFLTLLPYAKPNGFM